MLKNKTYLHWVIISVASKCSFVFKEKDMRPCITEVKTLRNLDQTGLKLKPCMTHAEPQVSVSSPFPNPL